jgi:hypothetical protein
MDTIIVKCILVTAEEFYFSVLRAGKHMPEVICGVQPHASESTFTVDVVLPDHWSCSDLQDLWWHSAEECPIKFMVILNHPSMQQALEYVQE